LAKNLLTHSEFFKKALVEQWNDGASASEVARYAHERFGISITRNAAVGVVHRYRNAHPTEEARRETNNAARTRLRVPRPVFRKVRAAPSLPPDVAEPEVIGPPGDFPSKGGCQYTKDDVTGTDWRMCGQASLPEKRWCEWHFLFRIRKQVQQAVVS
jgi:hypothetical protein